MFAWTHLEGSDIPLPVTHDEFALVVVMFVFIFLIVGSIFR